VSRKYKFHNPSAAYFVSFAVVNWMDVFIRERYFKILADSISYCRKEKGMELFAYCFMPSHVHFIFRSSNEKPMELIRDFKKFTAKKLILEISENKEESRREWLLGMMKKAADQKANVENYQFWQHNNHPIELWSIHIFKQKLNYIHKNPVVSGFVTNPIDWKYSSARNIMEHLDCAFEIDDIGFLG
jgi:REP-associated tyrosine transposase